MLAMFDKLGILVGSLAKRLATDVENALANSQDPAPAPGKLSSFTSMDGQMLVQRLIEESDDEDP